MRIVIECNNNNIHVPVSKNMILNQGCSQKCDNNENIHIML